MRSGAVAVFANTVEDLDVKWAVTKEGGVHTLVGIEKLSDFIYACTSDKHYSTSLISLTVGEFSSFVNSNDMYQQTLSRCKDLIRSKSDLFKFKPHTNSHKYVFGTVASRVTNVGRSHVDCGDHVVDIDNVQFITTVRGKKSMDEFTYISNVDHNRRYVTVFGPGKATLNAPLLHFLFGINPNCDSIIHFHRHSFLKSSLNWAPPGTIRDSIRNVKTSFDINNHGSFILLDKYGNRI